MRELKILREVQKREVRRALGINPYAPRLTSAQMTSATLAPELLALPQNVDTLAPLGGSAPFSFFFMLDMSSLDGPDGLA